MPPVVIPAHAPGRHTGACPHTVVIPAHAPGRHTGACPRSSYRHMPPVVIPAHAPSRHTGTCPRSSYRRMPPVVMAHTPGRHTGTCPRSSYQSSYRRMPPVVIPAYAPGRHTVNGTDMPPVVIPAHAPVCRHTGACPQICRHIRQIRGDCPFRSVIPAHTPGPFAPSYVDYCFVMPVLPLATVCFTGFWHTGACPRGAYAGDNGHRSSYRA